MTLVVAEFPEDSADLPMWLEQQLVGDRLAALVAELTGVQGSGPAELSLADVLGADTEAVRAEGLTRLGTESLRRLLARPALLLALQEWALLEGGPYWQRLFNAALPEQNSEQGTAWLKGFRAGIVRPAKEGLPDRRLKPSWYREPWVVALATAACFLVALLVLRLAVPSRGSKNNDSAVVATTWGWNGPEALRQDVSAREYLENLARAAEEWSLKRPGSAVELAQRLSEFRAGCSTLILTAHRPLSDRDGKWLKDRCHEWAEDIDKALTHLEEGGSVEAVRDEVDALVSQIIARALRDRAGRV
jgi:hypothetical protein